MPRHTTGCVALAQEFWLARPIDMDLARTRRLNRSLADQAIAMKRLQVHVCVCVCACGVRVRVRVCLCVCVRVMSNAHLATTPHAIALIKSDVSLRYM